MSYLKMEDFTMRTKLCNERSCCRLIALIAVITLILTFFLAACSRNNTGSIRSDNTGNDNASENSITANNSTMDSDNPADEEIDGTDGDGAKNAETSNNDGGIVNENNSQTSNDGENLVILISNISETATFYPITVDGTRMEVLAVTAPDGTIRTAFNTCQVCNGSPYAFFEQNGSTLECQNCGNRFPMEKVEVLAGGCNPVPILSADKTVTEETITIPYETLQKNAYRFPENWKQL
jgi:hypothetical protein